MKLGNPDTKIILSFSNDSTQQTQTDKDIQKPFKNNKLFYPGLLLFISGDVITIAGITNLVVSFSTNATIPTLICRFLGLSLTVLGSILFCVGLPLFIISLIYQVKKKKELSYQFEIKTNQRQVLLSFKKKLPQQY
ncbi:MAG: hypothetical protein MJB14_00785 [Spirochaetes bacterium]|nr:hypothetical protein [Spirochaetota bacterium]